MKRKPCILHHKSHDDDITNQIWKAGLQQGFSKDHEFLMDKIGRQDSWKFLNALNVIFFWADSSPNLLPILRASTPVERLDDFAVDETKIQVLLK